MGKAKTMRSPGLLASLVLSRAPPVRSLRELARCASIRWVSVRKVKSVKVAMDDGKPAAFLSGQVALLVALCFLLSGCAYYSTSATGGSGIRTVAVPLLENESLEAGIHQALTDSLIQGFVLGGAMRVVREDQADAVVQGTVLEVREDPFTYGDRADQYQISVFVKLSFYDARQKQVIWEVERMRGYGIYDASAQREQARQQGLGAALRMVAQDAVDRTQTGGW